MNRSCKHKKEIEAEWMKITFIGACFCGKTTLINKLINNIFLTKYIPTDSITFYYKSYNLSSETPTNISSVLPKEYPVHLILEDTFGINNPLLVTNQSLLNSTLLKVQKQEMSKQFKNILFTPHNKRLYLNNLDTKTKTSSQSNKSNVMQELDSVSTIERRGFVFVCDCENISSVSYMLKVIEKFVEIEKTNDVFFPKVIFFNKYDRLKDDVFNENISKYRKRLEMLRKNSGIISVKVSALNGEGLYYHFDNFIWKIYNEIINEKQNVLIDEDNDIIKDNEMKLFHPMCVDNINSCSKKVFCGNRLFICGNINNTINEGDEYSENESE